MWFFLSLPLAIWASVKASLQRRPAVPKLPDRADMTGFPPEVQVALTQHFETSRSSTASLRSVLLPWFSEFYAQEMSDQIVEDLANDDPHRHSAPSWMRWEDRRAPARGLPAVMRGDRQQDLQALGASLNGVFDHLGVPRNHWRGEVILYLLEGRFYGDELPRWMTHSQWGHEATRVIGLLVHTQGLPEAQAWDVVINYPIEELLEIESPAQAAQVVANNRSLLE